MESQFKRAVLEQVKGLGAIPHWRLTNLAKSFTSEEFWNYQGAKFAARYDDARAAVPYYRSRIGKDYPPTLGTPADMDQLHSCLKAFPILDKTTVKSQVEQFWRRPYAMGSAVHTTGGTTGSPLRVRAGIAERGLTQAILEARYLDLVGRRRPRILRLTGFIDGSDEKSGIWVTIPRAKVSYLSIYHIDENHRNEIISKVTEFAPELLYGYASAVQQFSAVVGPHLDASSRPSFAISTSETLASEQRGDMERSLGARVLNDYGSQEGQHYIFECRYGSMHIHPLRGIVEVLEFDRDEHVQAGMPGRVVVTGLMAKSMPLIRYDLGDSVISEGYRQGCQCGLAWPVVGQVVGRTEDLVRTRDGRRIGMLAYSAFKDASGVSEAQIVQRSYDRFDCNLVVPDAAGRSAVEAHVAHEMNARIGYPVTMRFNYLDRVPRTANGKFQAVIVDWDSSR